MPEFNIPNNIFKFHAQFPMRDRVPIIAAEIAPMSQKRYKTVVGMINSGLETSILSRDTAEVLNLNIKDGPLQYITTVLNQRIYYYVHDVSILIVGTNGLHQFNLLLGFSRQLKNTNLFGRDLLLQFCIALDLKNTHFFV